MGLILIDGYQTVPALSDPAANLGLTPTVQLNLTTAIFNTERRCSTDLK